MQSRLACIVLKAEQAPHNLLGSLASSTGQWSIPLLQSGGIDEGSVLGPILFTLYSQPLSDLICRHECDYHKHADDTQLSKGALPDQFQSLLCDIQTCIESLVGWMYSNKLKLNAEKTEVLPVASTSRLSSVGRERRHRWQVHIIQIFS